MCLDCITKVSFATKLEIIVLVSGSKGQDQSLEVGSHKLFATAKRLDDHKEFLSLLNAILGALAAAVAANVSTANESSARRIH
jgi:hypothetical protein